MRNNTNFKLTSERRTSPLPEFIASIPTGILAIFGVSFAFSFFVFSDPGSHSRQHDVVCGFDFIDDGSIRSVSYLIASIVSFLCAVVNNRNDKERRLSRKHATSNFSNIGNNTETAENTIVGKVVLGILIALLPVHVFCPDRVSSAIVSVLCAINIGVLLSCILKLPRKIAKYVTLGCLLHGLAWALSMSAKGVF